MVAIVCRFGGRINHSGGVVTYVGGCAVISHTFTTLNLHELKQLVRDACGFGVNIDLHMEWNMNNSLYEINSDSALRGIFEMCGNKLEVYVSTTVASSSIPSPMEPTSNTVTAEDQKSDEYDENEDCELITIDDKSSSSSDNGDDVQLTETDPSDAVNSRKLKQYPPEFTAGDWEEGFESKDWEITQKQSTYKNLQKGELFEDKAALQHAVKLWHIVSSRECGTYKSSKSELYYKCTNVSGGCCSWSLRGKRTELGYWEITKVGPPHSCMNTEVIQKHRQLDSHVIADLIYPYVYNNTAIKVCDLQQVVRDKFAQSVSYRKVWFSKKKIIEKMWGTHEGSYDLPPPPPTQQSQSDDDVQPESSRPAKIRTVRERDRERGT